MNICLVIALASCCRCLRGPIDRISPDWQGSLCAEISSTKHTHTQFECGSKIWMDLTLQYMSRYTKRVHEYTLIYPVTVKAVPKIPFYIAECQSTLSVVISIRSLLSELKCLITFSCILPMENLSPPDICLNSVVIRVSVCRSTWSCMNIFRLLSATLAHDRLSKTMKAVEHSLWQRN